MENIDIEKEFNGFDGLFNEVNSMLSQFGERVKLIRKFSSEASKEFDDNSLDFVFIDAGHEFIDCYNDILNWYPKVKENGLIMSHDWYHAQFKGVTKSVMKVFKTENIQYFKQPNHIWFVRKNSNNLSLFEKLKKKFLFYLNHPKLFFRVF
jgi:Methyltransferase domain